MINLYISIELITQIIHSFVHLIVILGLGGVEDRNDNGEKD
jgi:hypothetical protein